MVAHERQQSPELIPTASYRKLQTMSRLGRMAGKVNKSFTVCKLVSQSFSHKLINRGRPSVRTIENYLKFSLIYYSPERTLNPKMRLII